MFIISVLVCIVVMALSPLSSYYDTGIIEHNMLYAHINIGALSDTIWQTSIGPSGSGVTNGILTKY